MTWSPLLPGSFESYFPPSRPLRQEILAATLATTTDAQGWFRFGENLPANRESPSVVWVTAPDHVAAAELVRRDSAHVEALLPRGRSRQVRVVDSLGRPVAGAEVEQFGAAASEDDRQLPQGWAAARSFLRLTTTNSDGLVEPALSPAPMREGLQARSVGSVSVPWYETQDADDQAIILRLGDGFNCGGRVRTDDPTLRLDELVIRCRGIKGVYGLSFAESRVAPDGAWGPLAVPWESGRTWSLRLSGDEIATEEVSLGTLNPGEYVQREFLALRGMTVAVKAQDPEQKPLAGAEVSLMWNNAGDEQIWLAEITGEDGTAHIRGARPGFVRLSAGAPGHSKLTLDWMEIQPPPQEVFVITLERASPIVGRVSYETEAVKDFSIVWWTDELQSGAGAQNTDFREREDGQFELEQVPARTIWLMASAEGYSRSPYVRSEHFEGGRREVLLELSDAGRARGQVVDSTTAEPVSTARVQLWMNRGPDYVWPRASDVTVDPEGRFELEALAPGDNRFVVEADGYARYLGIAFGRPPHLIDVGRIPLHRHQPLTVVLVAEDPFDPAIYTATIVGTAHEGPLRFTPSRTAIFESCSPGWTRIQVEGPNGWERRQTVELLPGRDWIVEIPISQGGQLEVIVEAVSALELPEGLWATVFPPRSRAASFPCLEALTHCRIGADGRAVFQGIPVGPVAVHVWDEQGTTAATAVGRQETDDSTIVVALQERSHSFLVLDTEGNPIAEADVHLAPIDGSVCWNDFAQTDTQGLATIYGLPFDRFLAGARHPDHGMLFGEVIDLGRDASPTILRLDADAAIHAILREGSNPSSGIGVTLMGSMGAYIIGHLASDPEGHLDWPDLSSGTYDLRVSHPGFWPRTVSVSTAKPSEPVIVQIYRMGDLELNLKSSKGVPIEGQSIELRHVELAQSPLDWSALGLQNPPISALTSDSQGRVRIEDIPLGIYRWSVKSTTGATLEGDLELLAEMAAIEIKLP